MSENVEAVRKAYAALNRGDTEAVAAALHPEIEWRPYLGAVEGSVYRGRGAVIDMWSELERGFGGTLRVELLEVTDLGENVVAEVEAHATGSESGAEVRQRWAQLATLRDGLIVRVEAFPDRAEALSAAGREQS